jgi:hypothetical protein
VTDPGATAARAPATPAIVACALPAPELSRFVELLQRGVAVSAGRAATVEELLTGELGLDPRYVAERITTVFLDGQVVDRLDEAVLHEGSRLALSAAMPGLVGATLRRSGYYAAMRSAITLRSPAAPEAARGGVLVVVKLFNLLIAELGPVLLRRGVVVPRAEAERLLLAAGGGPAALPPGDPLELRVTLGAGRA